MNDAQRQQFQAALDAIRAAWDAIVQIAREILSAIGRWWRTLSAPIRRVIAPHRPTIMRKKIARYRRRC